MQRTITSPVLALTAAAVLGAGALAATTTAAAGGEPTRITDEYWGVECVFAAAEGHTVFLFGGGTTDNSEGGFGAFVEDADGRIVAETQGSGPAAYGDSLSTVLVLSGEDGDRELRLDASLTPGETSTGEFVERSGNSRTTGTMSETELGVDVTAVSLGGVPLDRDLGGCGGTVTAFDVFTTNPAGAVYRDTGFSTAICDVPGMADAQVRISGVWPEVVVELVVDHGAEQVEKAEGVVDLRGGAATLSTTLVDYWSGEEVTGIEIGVGARRAGAPERGLEGGNGFSERQTHTPYDVAVTVTTGDGRSGHVDCGGWLTTTVTRIAPHSGE